MIIFNIRAIFHSQAHLMYVLKKNKDISKMGSFNIFYHLKKNIL